MIKTDVVDQIAHELYKAEKDVYEVDKFVDQFPELDAELAYQVQDRLIEKKCAAENTKVAGRKLGLTSWLKEMMAFSPTYGVLLENMQLFEGETVSVKPFIMLRSNRK